MFEELIDRLLGKKSELADWTPSMPEAAATTAGQVKKKAEEDIVSEAVWHLAPVSSQSVAAYRLVDEISPLGGVFGARIEVEFRERTKQGFKFYRYYFGQNYKAARRVFDLLTSTPHPGEIIDRELKKKRVSYKPFG